MSRVSRWVMLLALVLVVTLTGCTKEKEDVLAPTTDSPPNGDVVVDNTELGGEPGVETGTDEEMVDVGEVVDEVTDVMAMETATPDTGTESGGDLAEGAPTTDATATVGAMATPQVDPLSTPLPEGQTGAELITPEPQATTIAVEGAPTPESAPPPVDPETEVATVEGDTAATPGTHTVQAGDTLYSIAVQYNTTVPELRALNNLTSDFVYVGQELRVPGGEAVAAPPATTNPQGQTVYTVQRGDWLYAIARRFNVSPQAIQQANPNVNLNVVYPGQQIIIPQ